MALPMLPLFVLEAVGLSYAQGPGFWGKAWLGGAPPKRTRGATPPVLASAAHQRTSQERVRSGSSASLLLVDEFRSALATCHSAAPA